MRILIIEDDRKLCDSLKFQLEKEGILTDLCYDGEDGLDYIRQRTHDLVLLDRMLPSMDGLTVLEKIRAEGISTPVILVTALGELSDKITGLNRGADDYLVKPYDFQELLARIRCIARRPVNLELSDEITFGDVTYRPAPKQLLCGSKVLVLSKREGALLEFLLRNPGQTLPRLTILSRVWGPNAEVEEGNLDNYIHFIRRCLRTVGSALTLHTVRGIGYCLEVTHE